MQGTPAGLVSRLLANAVDALTAAVLLGMGYLGLVLFRLVTDRTAFSWPTPSFGVLFVLYEGVLVAYFTLGWSATGRSVGKQVMGLRVVSHRGRRMRFPGALLRAVFCVVFPIGLLWVVVSRSNRSVQDLVLRSSVIYDWHRLLPAAAASRPASLLSR
jgi:uncharacterized RDD family membrane protein YckC